MSTAISSSPKDSAIKTTQVQLWSMGIIWGSELRHPPQSGAKRNKSGSKSTENAILGGRCQRRSLPAPRIPQSRQHRCSCGPWGSSGVANCDIRRSPGRRGINRGPKALKMPFWVADVNGDLFQPQGFRNQDNTGAVVVHGDHLGVANCDIRRSPGRRGINRGPKALKMPFWVADVNGDLFWPQGFRNHDNTRVIVVRGDHQEHRTAKSATVWGEEE
ncbi:hypothetical protein R3P38DRAFT_2779657 [Favolaschia claudopus]|uniref:Uncharacterized protein n=1 Tax=Favolaschia claudopus TaxID=2862362 RepID=A0AAW0BCH5_9AGAR